MISKDLMNMPLWQMTGEDFLQLQQQSDRLLNKSGQPPPPQSDRRYVYGLNGIAQLFGCSLPTALRIKKSGKIAAAVTQIGRKIIVDADLAMELAGVKSKGGRK